MAGEWKTTSLKEFCRKPQGGIQTGPFGSQLHRSDYTENGVPVIMPTNISAGRINDEGISRVSNAMADQLKRHRLREGDIIFSRRGEVDKCAVITSREVGWLCGTGCLLARVDRKLADARYIGYHISLPATRGWLRQNAVGLVMPNLNTAILERIPIHAPDRHEQEKIADLLASLDAKIDLSRETAATLDEMARALFKSWFVDFDPVRAKAAGLDTGLSAKIAKFFPDRFDDSGLPEGWHVESLLKFAALISGGTPKTDDPAYWDGSIPWASAKDVSQCPTQFLLSTERTITQRGLDESSTKLVPALSTVVVARGATTGRHRLLGFDMAMNQTCYALRAKDVHNFWLYCAFSNSIEKIVQSSHGSVFDTITTVTLNNADIIAGSPNIRAEFEILVTPIFSKILATTKESDELLSLRDALLPRLLSGQLRVEDAANKVAAA
jgi:type I restriction enzyme S subunit